MNVHDYMQRLRELLACTDIIIKERDEARRERDHARRERDEARDVMQSVVEEFVQLSQPSNPRHQPTPIHECEFQYAPEYGKCDACETWSDYVRICHPHADMEEDDNHNA